MAVVITGKIYRPFEKVEVTPTLRQRVFNINSANINGETDINTAFKVEMYVDGVLVNEADYSITGPLQITSDDPQQVAAGVANPGWDANLITFKFYFV